MCESVWKSVRGREGVREGREGWRRGGREGEREEGREGGEEKGRTLGDDNLNGHRKLAACLKLGPCEEEGRKEGGREGGMVRICEGKEKRGAGQGGREGGRERRGRTSTHLKADKHLDTDMTKEGGREIGKEDVPPCRSRESSPPRR